jgi:hypothetical protein
MPASYRCTSHLSCLLPAAAPLTSLFFPYPQADIDAFYVSVVKKLKGSNYIGPALLDALVTSTRTVSMGALEKVREA